MDSHIECLNKISFLGNETDSKIDYLKNPWLGLSNVLCEENQL